MVGEQLGVLAEEAVVRVRIDAQVCVGESIGEQLAVFGAHHRVVVADRHEGRLRDPSQTVELGGVGDPPGRDGGELGVAGGEIRRELRAGDAFGQLMAACFG